MKNRKKQSRLQTLILHLQRVSFFVKAKAQGFGSALSDVSSHITLAAFCFSAKRYGEHRAAMLLHENTFFTGSIKIAGGKSMRKIWRWALAGFLTVRLLLCAYAATPQTLVPGGNTIGLRLQTDGVAIVEFSSMIPQKAGLQCGDLICSVDGVDVDTAEGIIQAVSQSNGAPLELTVLRDGAKKTVRISPMQTADGWRLGLYVRDTVSGIGTVTYYDTDNHTFGALGHGVNDGQTLLPIVGGTVLPSEVSSVVKGEAGAPGALQGAVCGTSACGTICQNTPQGIFGTMDAVDASPLSVAARTEVHTGAATILSNVRGTQVEEFNVKICALYPDDTHDRNLLLEVTDPDLLAQTGGIVQGMSGSPIIQDGKLIGAVTHVLVDDPTQGYGIFIENMLTAAT